MGEKASEGQDSTRICTECGLKVASESAVCEHCGNVFKKTPTERNDGDRQPR